MKLNFITNNDFSIRKINMLTEKLSLLNGFIYIKYNNKLINAKSSLGILSINIKKGNYLEIVFEKEENKEKIKEIFEEVIL